MNPVHSAKFKSVNPVAFGRMSYGALNAAQREDVRKVHGDSSVGKITNFVVKKGLHPNALDEHEARRIRERNGGIKRVSVPNY